MEVNGFGWAATLEHTVDAYGVTMSLIIRYRVLKTANSTLEKKRV
jgi:hypothetical protein